MSETHRLWHGILEDERKLGFQETLRSTRRPRPAGEKTVGLPSLRLATPSAGDPRPTLSLGPELGRGGMGVVYRASQHELDREVAVKMAAEGWESEFVAEACCTGRLEHAGIPPVHFLGEDEKGRKLMALKLVEGKTWSQLISDGAALDEHLRIALAVADAVAFAHSRGVLHRDLKPDNIMVAGFGQVFVMDWGLAIPLDKIGDEPAQVLGTPAYMAPEQARGDLGAQGFQTDVYLLAGCLFEALGGRAPHDGTTISEVLENAQKGVLGPLPEVGALELRRILEKALAPEPVSRFASITDLAEALNRFVDHEGARQLLREAESVEIRLRLVLDEDGDEAVVSKLAGELDFAYRQASARWPEGPAPALRRKVLGDLFNRAISTDDLAQAERLAADLADPALDAPLECLRQQLADESRRVAALRDFADARDASAVEALIAALVGRVGVAVAIGAGASSILRRVLSAYDGPLIRLALWMPPVLWVAAFAWRRFRRAQSSGRLVSLQVVAVWGAVALSCTAVELIAWMLELPGFTLLGVEALIVGLAFAFLATSTRAFLVIPAAICAAAGLAITAAPAWGREILGATVVMVCAVIAWHGRPSHP